MENRSQIPKSPMIYQKSRRSLAHIPSSRIINQENITADLGALVAEPRDLTTEKQKKKLRSKSIGPGGLDTLSISSAHNRKLNSVVKTRYPALKPILKLQMPSLEEATVPVSTPLKTQHGAILSTADMTNTLIDISVSPCIRNKYESKSLTNILGLGLNAANNQIVAKPNIEGDQEIPTSKYGEKEDQNSQNAIISRREARRKSLANRRVSFAPEATLHTWDVVVEYQDSTTSTNSTNSTKRYQSTACRQLNSPNSRVTGSSHNSPSSPKTSGQVEKNPILVDHCVTQSNRHVPSSITLSSNFNNPNDGDFSPSPSSGGSDDDINNLNEDDVISSDSDSCEERTSITLDDKETTSFTTGIVRSNEISSPRNQSEEANRQEIYQPGTQSIEYYDNNNMKENEQESVIHFTKFPKDDLVSKLKSPLKIETSKYPSEGSCESKPVYNSIPKKNLCEVEDPIPRKSKNSDEISMDVTRALGSIISKNAFDSLSYRELVPEESHTSPHRDSSCEDLEGDSMDITAALSGILISHNENSSRNLGNVHDLSFHNTNTPLASHIHSYRKDQLLSPEKLGLKGSNISNSIVDDRLLDITTAIGENFTTVKDSPMDITTAIGGILTTRQDSPMDMTTAIGGILTTRQDRPIDASPNAVIPKKTREISPDITNSLGKIFTSKVDDFDTNVLNLNRDKKLEVTNASSRTIPSTQDNISESLEVQNFTRHKSDFETFSSGNEFRTNPHIETFGTTLTVISATGSPSLAEGPENSNRNNFDKRNLDTLRSGHNKTTGTPTKKLGVPPKQLTPLPSRFSSTLSHVSPHKKIITKIPSPRRLSNSETKLLIPPTKSNKKPETPNKNSFQDESTGSVTPNLILTPQIRQSSGIGFDKIGLGSPRVAEILDRRGSISNQARSFVPGELVDASLGARLKDPRVIEQELEREIKEGEHKSDYTLLDQGTDRESKEKDATLHLKEMIHSLTPKKKPVNNRKSLLIGTARGILGKRPIELDEADEDCDEDDRGIKRLRNHPDSPVKSIRLHAPPSKFETTSGRIVKAPQKGFREYNPDIFPNIEASSGMGKFSTSPNESPNDADLLPIIKISTQDKEVVENAQASIKSHKDQRIQLQDFLNMTSIRFMELTTTKRRYTIAPRADKNDACSEKSKVSWEDCIAAGAATIPMLELFQHACHELKRYISEGRKTIQEIETETWEENPPLFHEYISATPDLRFIMDNQLKNVKTYSRLLSKGLWYDWRMTLLSTLKEGLIKSTEDMASDKINIDNQQSLLDSVLPSLANTAENLKHEEHLLKAIAEEIANCNKEELNEARQTLTIANEEFETKKLLLEEFCQQLQQIEAEIEVKSKVKQGYQVEINESEKIREEFRGWTCTEINAIKRRVEEIEKLHGWMITAISGTRISMTYQKDIVLVFDAFSPENLQFEKQAANSTIEISYVGANRNLSARLNEVDFFVQCIQNSLHKQAQREMRVKGLLDFVSTLWKKACKVMYDIRLLILSCPTEVTKISDTSMTVRSTLLIEPLATKVAIIFDLTIERKLNEIDFKVVPKAHVIYGERLNEHKMSEFLLNRCGDFVKEKSPLITSSWGDAIGELEEKLIAKRRK